MVFVHEETSFTLFNKIFTFIIPITSVGVIIGIKVSGTESRQKKPNWTNRIHGQELQNLFELKTEKCLLYCRSIVR